jgi:hypothetical protein
VIILASGAFQFLSDSVGPSLNALKATGPLIVAIAIKILVFDFILATKSAFLFVGAEDAVRNPPPGKKLTATQILIGRGSLVSFDLVLSAIITGWFLVGAQHFQSLHAESIAKTPILPSSIKEFFDEVHLALTDSIENSHFILNGSFLFYLLLGVSLLIEGSLHRIDVQQIQKNVFKLVGALFSMVVLITVVSYKLAAD